MVDFKMIDLMGRWRHLTIPVERFTQETLDSGIGFDSSNYGYASVEKSDMVFIPDLSTAVEEPFVEIPTLSMIGDVYVIDEPPRRFDQDPRGIAAKAEEYMRSTGIADTMMTGPEFEFYVFDHISYEVSPQSSGFRIDAWQAEWNSKVDDRQNLGYKVPHKGGYHMTAPMDIMYDLRSRMSLLLQERGIDVKYHHHEVGGPGQLEIEIEAGPDEADGGRHDDDQIPGEEHRLCRRKDGDLSAQAPLRRGRQRDARTHAPLQGRKARLL